MLIRKVVPVLFFTAAFIFLVEYLLNLHLLYYIQPFICTFNNNNKKNKNKNNNHNHNHNHNDDDNDNGNDNENDQSSIFNLHQLYICLQYICCPFRKF